MTHRFRPGFIGYLFVVHGDALVSATTGGAGGALDEGGAAKIVDEPDVTVAAGDTGAELLLVETLDVDRQRG